MVFKAPRGLAPVFMMSFAVLAAHGANAQSGRPLPLIRIPQPATPSTNPQLAVGQIPAPANVYGLISDLAKRVNALEKQVGQLTQVNADQSAQLQSLAAQSQSQAAQSKNLSTALGQAGINIANQGQELAVAKQSIAGLNTKFANHTHPFSYLAVDYWNVSVVKESHVSGDDMQEVAHITGNHAVPSMTGAPQ